MPLPPQKPSIATQAFADVALHQQWGQRDNSGLSDHTHKSLSSVLTGLDEDRFRWVVALV